MQFRYLPHADHLLVHAREGFDADAARAAIVETIGICSDRNLDRVLFDGREVSDMIPVADRFDLASFLASKQTPIRMAVLVSEAQVEKSKTFENTAVNRGSAVITTSSEADARRFLGVG